jgi:hypothetical protein
LNPRAVKALTVLGFAIPAVGYLAVLQHYTVNAVVADQWDDVWLIHQSYLHGLDWSSLWALHTNNRILFPNLIVLALAHTVHFNISVEEYLSAVMLFASTALFIWSHKRRSPNTPLIFYCPVAFLALSLAQWQDMLWGFQMAWYLVLLCLAVAIVLLDRPSLTWPTIVAATLVAIVGSYSCLQGLLIWPVGLMLLYYRRRPPRTVVSWIIAGGATAGLYFYNFNNGNTGIATRYTWHHPYLALKFYVYALGDIVGVPLQLLSSRPPNAAVMVFGVLILALAALVLITWGIRRDERGGHPIGIALIVFGLLFDASITSGRVYFGLGGAAQSRYATYDVLVLAGIYLTVLSASPTLARGTRGARRTARSGQPAAVAWLRDQVERIDRRAVLWVASAAIVIQVAFSVHYGLEGAREQHQLYTTAASVTRNIDTESNVAVEWTLNFSKSAKWLRAQAEFLRVHQLSQFG